VLLGEILADAGGEPVKDQLESRVLDELELDDTLYTTTSELRPPVLHGYSSERGDYEDSGFWNPSWATNTGNMSSNLTDMGRWARALGTGELLTKRSHDQQVGDQSVGLGPLTEALHYGMGLGVANGWIVANPQLMGYTGVVAYLPEERAAVVVSATPAQGYEPGRHYAAEVFNAVAEVLSPDHAPNLPTLPRG